MSELTTVAGSRPEFRVACGVLCGLILTMATFDSTAAALTSATPPATAAKSASILTALPRMLPEMQLYDGAVPNSVARPVQELAAKVSGGRVGSRTPRPTLQVWLPGTSRTSHTAVLLFPGGAYHFLSREWEGEIMARELQDRGITAILVNYRLPSDITMKDKSIGPLQDAQQALRVVRAHAAEWDIRADRVGVMGFSVGGHIAAMVSTQFGQAYVPNPEHISLRPDFSILVYPLISMQATLTHADSRTALLGTQPSEAQLKKFSADLQVSDQTPPTLLLAASDDTVVDVDNSIGYYEALRRHHVPAGLILLPDGGHGFFMSARNRWLEPLWDWLEHNGWLVP